MDKKNYRTKEGKEKENVKLWYTAIIRQMKKILRHDYVTLWKGPPEKPVGSPFC